MIGDMTSLSMQDFGLRPAQLKALDSKARRQGKSREAYVRYLIERDLLAERPFDKIAKPIREDFRRAGVTEEQLDAIVRRARKSTEWGRRAR
jgi:hypothetical protein